MQNLKSVALSVGALCLAPCIARAQQQPQQPPPPVRVVAGTNLQALVDRSPAGAAFLLEAGLYRLQSVEPKDGQSFTGEPGATLNGARILTGFVPDGQGLWWAPVEPAGEPVHGICLQDRPRCSLVDDIFLDGRPLAPVASLPQLDSGSYYWDTARSRLYLARNPMNAVVEVAEAPFAFRGRAANVVIRGLTIEKYGNRAQYAAIMGFEGSGWRIEGNTVQYNHGVGISGGPRCLVRDNIVRFNGQLGVSGDGAAGRFEGNEIAFNNTRGYTPEWEAGGAKFAETDDTVVRGNFVHHNAGFGMWTDIDSRSTTYEDNVVTDNDYGGILIASSAGIIVRNNLLARNGKAKSAWLWGGQIMVVTSERVDVGSNTVIVDSTGGNGITLIDQDRGVGRFGPRRLAEDSVHDNLVVYQGEAGLSGAANDGQFDLLPATIRFDRNTYVASPSGPPRWYWLFHRNWDAFRAGGHEVNGSFIPPFPQN